MSFGPPASIRIALVDDQAMVRAGFRMILESEPDFTVVGEAADGADAVQMVARSQPHVVLMDVRMPGMDGIEATRRILSAPAGDRRGGAPRVLILTTFDLEDHVYASCNL